MEWIAVTLSMYRRVVTRAASLAVKNWPVLLTLFAYFGLMMAAAAIAAPLGMLGGFVIVLVRAACASSFLYLVEMIVRTSKVTLDDFWRSFGEYLWDVLGVMFLFWLFFNFATPAVVQLPQGGLILLCVQIAVAVICNAVPELIYLGHYSSVALLTESYTFIGNNWIEWFPVSAAAAVLLYAVAAVPTHDLGSYVQLAGLALLVYFTMVMRGLLFLELSESSYRGRAFKYRTGT